MLLVIAFVCLDLRMHDVIPFRLEELDDLHKGHPSLRSCLHQVTLVVYCPLFHHRGGRDGDIHAIFECDFDRAGIDEPRGLVRFGEGDHQIPVECDVH
jgi:hypothetical protein